MAKRAGTLQIRGGAGTRPGLLAERGLMLIELLVVSLIMVIVITGVLALYQVSVKEQDRVEGGVRGLINQRNGLERMSRELRQANTVCSVYPTCGTSFSDGTSVDFQRCSGNGSGGCTQVWVRYNCSGTPAQASPPALTTRACLRSQASTATGLGSSPTVVVGDVATTPTGIFTFTEPNYVAVSMKVKAKGAANPISLDDGVRLRNVNETPDSGEQGS